MMLWNFGQYYSSMSVLPSAKYGMFEGLCFCLHVAKLDHNIQVFMVGISMDEKCKYICCKVLSLYVGPPQTKDALSVELGEFRTSAMNSLGNSEYWNNLQNAVTSTFSHFSINFSN